MNQAAPPVPFNKNRDKIHISNSLIYKIQTIESIENTKKGIVNDKPCMYIGKMLASHRCATRHPNEDNEDYVKISSLLAIKLGGYLSSCKHFHVGKNNRFVTVYKLLRNQEVVISVVQILNEQETENIAFYEHNLILCNLRDCVNEKMPNVVSGNVI